MLFYYLPVSWYGGCFPNVLRGPSGSGGKSFGSKSLMGFDYMLWGEEKDEGEGEERRGRKKPQYKGRYLAGPTKTDKLAWKMEALVLLSLCTILVPFWATIFQSESQNIKHDCLLQLQYSLSNIPPKFSGHWPVIILLLLHNKISAVLWLYMHHTYIHVLGSRIRIMDVCITHICIFASCTYPDGQKIYACYVQCIMDIRIKHTCIICTQIRAKGHRHACHRPHHHRPFQRCVLSRWLDRYKRGRLPLWKTFYSSILPFWSFLKNENIFHKESLILKSATEEDGRIIASNSSFIF